MHVCKVVGKVNIFYGWGACLESSAIDIYGP